jgi:hypothetical protein
MICPGLVGCNKSFPLIVTQCLNGHPQHSGDCSDGVYWR